MTLTNEDTQVILNLRHDVIAKITNNQPVSYREIVDVLYTMLLLDKYEDMGSCRNPYDTIMLLVYGLDMMASHEHYICTKRVHQSLRNMIHECEPFRFERLGEVVVSMLQYKNLTNAEFSMFIPPLFAFYTPTGCGLEMLLESNKTLRDKVIALVYRADIVPKYDSAVDIRVDKMNLVGEFVSLIHLLDAQLKDPSISTAEWTKNSLTTLGLFSELYMLLTLYRSSAKPELSKLMMPRISKHLIRASKLARASFVRTTI